MRYSDRLELFERVRAKYAHFLESVLWKLTGDRELFAEAVQNSLLKIWQHIEKLNSPSGKAYLYRIAQSSASKAWRNRVNEKPFIEADFADDVCRPDEEISGNESSQRIRYAITHLPAKQAKAVIMRYIEQKDYQAVAAEMKCTEATARSNVSKALVALKRKLCDE